MQTHVLSCSEWTEIREDLNMHNISHFVTFFKRLLVEKDKRNLDNNFPDWAAGLDDDFSFSFNYFYMSSSISVALLEIHVPINS